MKEYDTMLQKGDIVIMENEVETYAIQEEERKRIHKQQVERTIKEINLIKEQLEERFGFEIESYIIHDIVSNEDYHHFKSMVNLAIDNNRLTEENAETLKQGIKELFEIEGDFDRLNKAVVLGGFNYDKWYKQYHNEEIIDLNKYLDRADKKILKKLSITLKDKVLTNYEYDLIKGYVLEYYRNEDEMNALELAQCKPLEGTGVTREEYNKVLAKFEDISKEYGIF